MNKTVTEFFNHNHNHAQNRFAVIPTVLRLRADEQLTGRGVTIAILDSGFYPHADLTMPVNRILAFHDVSGLENTLDEHQTVKGYHWHGTQTSVVAAGNGFLSNGQYRGLASEANVVLIKASDEKGRITEENIACGIDWVVENRERYRIRILSISLGGDQNLMWSKSIVDQSAERAVQEGIVVVVAAGNSGFDDSQPPIPPANSPSVITVGGYDDENRLGSDVISLYHSNYGVTADGIVKPEIIAPAAWVATPILPDTPSYKLAEVLSELYDAPDYLLPNLLMKYSEEIELPAYLLMETPNLIRAEIESRLRENKIVATHYQHGDGTSFATPIVASLVAQMLEANPRLTPAAVKQILIATADRLSHAPAIRQGFGMVNAARAVAEAGKEHHELTHTEFGPPRVMNGLFLFTYHNDTACKVSLVGDFNDWHKSLNPFMKTENGLWRAMLPRLSTGNYRYKFLVDDKLWIEDPGNGLKESDGFSGFNSLLHVM